MREQSQATSSFFSRGTDKTNITLEELTPEQITRLEEIKEKLRENACSSGSNFR